MQEGILFIIIGFFWLLIVALIGRRKQISLGIYALIGIFSTGYGIFHIIINLTWTILYFFIAAVVFIFAGTVAVLGWKKHREDREPQLSDNTVPEASAEDLFIQEVYKKENDDKNRPIL